MIFKQANYDTMPKVERIVVLAAGPSAKKAINKVRNWKNKNTVVIVTNYRFPIKANYTFFVSPKVFQQQYKNVTGKIVITKPYIKIGQYRKDKNIMKRIVIFKCGKEKVWNIDKIDIDKKGVVQHDIASSGFGALLFATYFDPTELLILGFDGPNKTDKKYILNHFNGKKQKRVLDERHIKLDNDYRNFMKNKMIPYLFDSGIKEIYLCKEDRFRGIDKNELKVKVL